MDMVEDDEVSVGFTEAGSSMDNGPVEIIIACSHAFGDGRHATTRLCVAFLTAVLDRLDAEEIRAMSLLDVGTGTGILSIIAAKLGVGEIDAIDISPHAVNTAQKNFEANACRVVCCCQSDISSFQPGRDYDVVAANIISSVILENIDTLIGLTKPGGVLIVSGISEQTRDDVRRAFEMRGLRIIDCASLDGWNGFHLERPRDAGRRETCVGR